MTARIPPNGMAAERAILGQAIMEPEHTDAILEQVRPEYLYRPQHQRIMESVAAIREHGQMVTLVGVRDHLINRGVMTDDGKALAYLSEVCLLSSPFFFAREIEIVLRTYHQRLHIALAAKLVERAQEACVNHDDIKQAVLDGLEAYESLFLEVLQNGNLPVGQLTS
jgi:replicative DNA helicase